MLINPYTKRELEILTENEPRNAVLLGPAGMGKYQCALDLAAKWLGCTLEELTYHPDFLQIAPEAGVIRSEQADVLIKKARFFATYNKVVCIVNGAECMTVDLQNKLLKVLEDENDNFVVLFVSTAHLIETVLSRCVTVYFDRVDIEDLYASMSHPSVACVLAADGSPGLYEKIMSDNELSQYLDGFYQAFLGLKEREQLKQILKLTHALKEKDRQYIPDMFDSWQLAVFLTLIEKIYYYIQLKQYGAEVPSFVRLSRLPELYTREEITVICEETAAVRRQQARKGKFTKHDFFFLLMHAIPVNEI